MSNHIKCSLPRIRLPLLHTVHIAAVETEHEPEIPQEEGIHMSLLIHVILTGATNLHTCIIDTYAYDETLPAELLSLVPVLPKGVSTLELGGSICGHNLQQGLELLDLPNLGTLKLCVSSAVVKIPALHFLQTLEITQGIGKPASVLFSSPLKNLRVLRVQHIALKPESGLKDLTEYLPNLATIDFCCQQISKLKTWLPSTTVQALKFNWLVEETGLRPEVMQWLHQSYPNVTCLKLDYVGGKTPGLLYVFQEIRQLKTLETTWIGAIEDGDGVESVLTGTPVSFKAALKHAYPAFREAVSTSVEKLQKGIRLLTELVTLKLSPSRISKPSKKVTGITFQLAFLHMPQLRSLTLNNCYQIKNEESQKISEEWKRQVPSRNLIIT